MKQYIDLFESQKDALCAHSSAVINSHRDAAFDAFCRMGFPSRKVERYKYTDIAKLFEPDYGVNINRLAIPVNPYEVFRCGVPNLKTSTYFVVNDAFYATTAADEPVAEGVVIDSLNTIAKAQPELVERFYNRLADNADAISALNTMLCQDGLIVYVPRGVKVEKAIQVINITRGDVDMMSNRRVLIVMEERSELNILFCDHSNDDRQMLVTQVVEAFVGEGSHLDMTTLEHTNAKNTLVSNTYISQEASSVVYHNAITLHNGTTRQQLDLVFKGEGAECYCNGGAILDGSQHLDNNTIIDHKVGHCDSHELYKYVVDETAVGAFAGRVLVEKDAQKTSSAMTNQNLLATKEARMYTQPMLEIYADDVKCSHGSTIGQLSDAALFYMQQRGVPLKEAKTLLQVAFITEVVDAIRLTPLRERLHHLIDRRFRGDNSHCAGCDMC